MSESETSTREILVHVLQPGVGVSEYRLADGSTLADLLRASDASTSNQAVLVDGLSPEEALPLSDGAVVTIAPRMRNCSDEAPWHSTVPAFQDERLFQEYRDALNSFRDEVGLQTDQEG